MNKLNNFLIAVGVVALIAALARLVSPVFGNTIAIVGGLYAAYWAWTGPNA